MSVKVERYGESAWLHFGEGNRGNALTRATRLQLLEELKQIADDDSIRAVVLEGRGDHFCTGQDVRVHHEALVHEPESIQGATRREFSPIVQMVTSMPKPVIACLRGTVAGAGLGLALACDLRIAAADTRFSTSFTRIGLGPDSGVSYFLPRLVGISRATDYLLRPRVIDSAEAVSVGLLHEIVDPVEVRVREIAAELASGPTLAYAAVKDTLGHSAIDLAGALDREAQWQEQLVMTRDHFTAVEAFVKKTTPTFKAC